MGCGPPPREGVYRPTRHSVWEAGSSQVALPTSLSRGSGRAAARAAGRYVPGTAAPRAAHGARARRAGCRGLTTWERVWR